MRSIELKRRFLEFFQKREHVLVPLSSFLTKNYENPFVTSGIEVFSPYFSGDLVPPVEKDSFGKPLGPLNPVSSQRCFRIQDSELVGDDSHLTSFEMLGAYTFGGYKKQTAIKVANDFFKNLNLFIDYVTVFGGDAGFSLDKDAEYVWKELGVSYIQRLGLKENFWGPGGMGGVCGPTSEIYIKDMGVWSIVFLDYYFSGNHEELVSGKSLRKLEKLEVGGIASVTGLERLTAIYSGKSSIFETDIFESLFLPLQNSAMDERQKRIVVDHLRTVCFFMNELRNYEQEQMIKTGMQTLLRRLFVYERLLKLSGGLLESVAEKIVQRYNDDFKSPAEIIGNINGIMNKERAGFAEKTEKGLKKLLKMRSNSVPVNAQTAFHLFEKFGLPLESIKEFGGTGTKNLTQEDFKKELEKHLPVSEKKQKESAGFGLKIKELWNKIP